ncbi:hypothetical protein [Stenotrophomonas sp. NPDC077659]|uniref:hypothetical protein n=1 Tax=Stenotrophomonas sp. NPDC077659 TaxID=3390694 RepID=UPI003D07EAC3
MSLFNRGMLFQELAPAAILFICAVGLAFYGGLEPRKKLIAIVILCVVASATSASTAMLALRSKIVINGATATLHAGFWKAELPAAQLAHVRPTDQIGDSLRKRKNGMSSRGVNAGWFEDPNGKRVFALSAGRTPVLLTTSSGISLVLDQSTADEIAQCGRSESSR